MPDEIDLGDIQKSDSIATCSQCDWTVVSDAGIDWVKAMAVAHVIKRHPLVYADATGKDPEAAALEHYQFMNRDDVKGLL